MNLKRDSLLLLFLTSLFFSSAVVAEEAFPLKAKKILFLGDSITNSGQYVGYIETQLRLQGLNPMPEFINLGLSSETCSGLSEPDHPFPRPDVHERLNRALAKIKPDVVFACYGMNDGIYYPLSDERFAAYKKGVKLLSEKVHAAGAKLVLLTPPPFDPVPVQAKLKPAGEEKYAYFAVYKKYDDVLKAYAKWIMQQKDLAELVIDIRTPIMKSLTENRKTNPKFAFTRDGVHPNEAAHVIMGTAILKGLGVQSIQKPSAELFKTMNAKTKVLHDAWLSEVGHKRPGGKPGLPIKAANAKAAELLKKAEALIRAEQKPKESVKKSTQGTIYQVHFPASLEEGELRLYADYYLWIPQDVKKIRGVIVHQHGCGVGASIGGRTAADDLHWQALAKKWDCALMGSCYQPEDGVNCRSWCDCRNGSDNRFLDSLSHFAMQTNHLELKTVPWCLWGHSGGGFWASLMQVSHPERIVAIWFQSGTAYGYWSQGTITAPKIPDAAYGVPVMGNPGLKEKTHERFKNAWNGTVAMRDAYREKGAFFEFAPDPLTSHETGDSRYLSIPFFDFWLEHRLPKKDAVSADLSSNETGKKDWDKVMAGKLAEFIKMGSVSDTTPPPAPLQVTVNLDEKNKSAIVTWEAEADFESGLRGFIIERDGKEIARVPADPKSRFGRPLFQGMSYHDTPNPGLPEMKYIDTDPQKGKSIYGVRSINSVEIQSEVTKSNP